MLKYFLDSLRFKRGIFKLKFGIPEGIGTYWGRLIGIEFGGIEISTEILCLKADFSGNTGSYFDLLLT